MAIPPPPNPQPEEIQQASDLVEQSVSQISALIAQVAAADQQLAEIDEQLATQREDANKALVDLQNSRDIAASAAAVANHARIQLDSAGAAILQAQERFNKFLVAAYRQGGTTSSLSVLVDSIGPDELLTRSSMLAAVADKHNSAMENLERARITEANTDSAARASQVSAENALTESERKKDEAQSAIAASLASQDSAVNRIDQITQDRETAQAELDLARANVAGLQNQREVYAQQQAKREADEAASREAADTASQAAADAAARAAADVAAQRRAAAIAEQERPHTQIVDESVQQGHAVESAPIQNPAPSGASDGGATNSGLSGNAAIETVIDRAMSQLGVRYSWGGGSANGPTVGIRDGGVADTFGDYKNVGFDCSGLMMYAFAGAGISLPHYSGYQYTSGTHIPTSEMRRGDLIFYGPDGGQHEALYLGNGQMLEAAQSGDVVKISPVRWGGMTPFVTRLL
ncbi:NlpC/P60 family protein [Tomitella biformata]|uniref:NlpC/P60 family protein n=1 Tax=Tomitella biformata TaxID=630403 RepID=UPI0011DE3C6A|nr:NlpC/P60 family protein [Tomitella biformata]